MAAEKFCKKLMRSGSDLEISVMLSWSPTNWAVLADERYDESTCIFADIGVLRRSPKRRSPRFGNIFRRPALIRGPIAGGQNFTGRLGKLSLVDRLCHFGQIRIEIGAGAEIVDLELRWNVRKSCRFSTQRPMVIPDRLSGADNNSCLFLRISAPTPLEIGAWAEIVDLELYGEMYGKA